MRMQFEKFIREEFRSLFSNNNFTKTIIPNLNVVERKKSNSFSFNVNFQLTMFRNDLKM